MTIDQIKQPVLDEYKQFLEDYHHRTTTNVELLDQVVAYLNQSPGKQLRPLLVLLSAKACQHLGPQHIKLATAIEMLHNASLMHDDVVDESDSRRDRDSVRHHWSNQVAVLCGDYFLSQVMSILQEVDSKPASEILSQTVAIMCQGELMQLASINQDIKESSYIDIIGRKTAALMSTCCEFGAFCFDGEPNKQYVEALKEFGYHYGIVFQIRDDINDFNNQHDVALPKGISAQELIDKHVALAQQAMAPLPDSEAKQIMLAMLLPSAPQPVH